MKRTVIAGVFTLLIPASAFAYLPDRFAKQASDPPGGSAVLRRSRRLVLSDRLHMLEAHRAQPSGVQIYSNLSEGIRLRYPAAWAVRERLYGTLVSFLSPVNGSSDTVRENINIFLRELPVENASLDDFTLGTLLQLKLSDPALVFLASERKILGDDITAHRIVYEKDSSLGRMRFEQVWGIVGNRVLLLTFTTTPETYEHYRDSFDTMTRTVSLSY